MENKLKQNIVSLLATIVIMLTALLLGGCGDTIYLISSWEEVGFLVDKIIYTDDVNKYYDESKAVKYLDSNGYENILGEEIKYGKCMYSSKQGYVDWIIDTSEISAGLGVDFAYGEMRAYSDGKVGAFALFDNSHIFSAKRNGLYNKNGEFECDDPNCPGPASDEGCNCGGECMYTGVTYTSPVELSYEEICEALDMVNNDSEFTYEEEFDGENYIYTKVYYNHTHDSHYVPSQTWETAEWYQLKGEDPKIFELSKFLDFNELIIDGYDFSQLSNFIQTFDYSPYYYGTDNWRLFPNNYSYMFSDLPVEKITIKRVSGLGDEVQSLEGMFQNCVNLKTVEFGNFFDNIKPTNITKMFYNCPSLETVDLSKLDTSRVTSMDYMFGTRNSLTLEKRDQIINKYINEVMLPQFPELDQTIEYDLEMAAEIMGETKSITLMALMGYGLNVPMTYDEWFEENGGAGLAELAKLAQTKPSDVFYDFSDSREYTAQHITTRFRSGYESEGFEPGAWEIVYDADLCTDGTRDAYVEYVLNDMWVVLYPELNNGAEWTISSLAEYLGVSETKIVFDVASFTGFGIPLTYEEASKGFFNMTFEQVVTQANTNPEVLGWSQQKDTSGFTITEVKYMLRNMASMFNSRLMTEEELEKYNNITTPTKRGKTNIILGGVDSKFIIPQGVSANLVFAGNNNIASILAPVFEDSNATLELGYNFTDGDNYVTSVLTSNDSNKTLYYDIDDSNAGTIASPDSGGFKVNMTIIYIIIGSSVAIASIVVVVALMPKRKKW